VPSIDESGKLNPRWPSKVDDGVQSRTNRTAGKENVIDQHYSRASDRKRKLGPF
jgi:hypothetical protein